MNTEEIKNYMIVENNNYDRYSIVAATSPDNAFDTLIEFINDDIACNDNEPYTEDDIEEMKRTCKIIELTSTTPKVLFLSDEIFLDFN